ncbi:hypothetical protein HDU67_004679 [Dinochytrium kinnereticum]|nr:hypothetical protein HDU67_004679 [Dinochytrium kinnereticum]
MPVCPRCTKQVYFAEQVWRWLRRSPFLTTYVLTLHVSLKTPLLGTIILVTTATKQYIKITGPGGMWHKMCMTCKECNKRLDSTNVTEKDKEAYCKTCYGKLHGPKGYGYGGGAGTLSTDSTITNGQRFSPPSTSPMGSTSDLGSGTLATLSTSSSAQHLAEKSKLASQIKSTSNACPKCSKQVYFAEQVLGPGGVKYHKLCFRCVDCNKGLDSTNMAEKDSVIYCRGCHGKKFGPKGYGYAAGASFMHTEGTAR